MILAISMEDKSGISTSIASISQATLLGIFGEFEGRRIELQGPDGSGG